MDKNTLVTIIKKDNDGNITELKKILAGSFETADVPTGWKKVDNRPVLMERKNGKFVEKPNAGFEEAKINAVKEFKQKGRE
jgi:hypothetical protein